MEFKLWVLGITWKPTNVKWAQVRPEPASKGTRVSSWVLTEMFRILQVLREGGKRDPKGGWT